MRLFALCGVALWALTGEATKVVHEKRNQFATSRGWTEHAVEDRSVKIRAAIALKQRNIEDADDFIADVSHPESANYGKFWTQAKVDDIFSPSPESREAVGGWLSRAGIEGLEQSSDQGWIKFDASIEQLDALLSTTFHHYHNHGAGKIALACSDYSLPQEVASHVDYVLPGVNPLSYPMKRTPRAIERRDATRRSVPQANSMSVAQTADAVSSASGLPSDLQHCGYNITPPCLRALYDLPYPSSPLGDSQLGIREGSVTYSQADLNEFFVKYAPYVPNSTHPFDVSIDGAQSPSAQEDASAEADLDFQVAYGLLGDANVTQFQVMKPVNYTTGFLMEMEGLLAAVDSSFCTKAEREEGFMCGSAVLTNVLSVSQETPELFHQSVAYQQRACHAFMKLGLQGKTIIFSSGDYGVATDPDFGEPTCSDNGCAPQDLQNQPLRNSINNGTIFMPNFPSNCPYVLSVGATQVAQGKTVRNPEIAMLVPNEDEKRPSCNPYATFSSSGGFANYFRRPKYQEQALSSYFSNHRPSYLSYDSNGLDVSNNATNIGKNGGIFNRAGRGIPDVSAIGQNFRSFYRGVDTSTNGTSVAAPIWGSIVAMLNSERAKAGKGPVGFINSVLYEHPEVFHDIVDGNNPGCGTQGFSAVPGWDPVTGLGTPNYPALKKLFLSLP